MGVCPRLGVARQTADFVSQDNSTSGADGTDNENDSTKDSDQEAGTKSECKRGRERESVCVRV